MKPGSAWWCHRQWAGTDAQKFHLNVRKNFTVQWPNTGTGCPERTWSLPLWKYSRTIGHSPVQWALGWSCLSREAGHVPFQPYPSCGSVESVNIVLTAVGHRGRRHNHEGQAVCLWSLAGVTAKQTPLLLCSYSKLQRSFTGGSTTANHLCPHPATTHCPALLWLLPRLEFLLLLAALILAFPLQCYSRERG